MARAIWSGSISFGLVNVPVKLFTSVRKKDVRFNQLHAADNVRIQQKRVCPADGEEVSWDDLVKGYEVSPGQYVVVTNEELDALDPEATHTVDIEDFVALEDIDPLYFDSSYYLVPDSTGVKPYRLLLDAMTESGRVGVGRVVLRTKQYLCAVRPLGDALVLTTMNFADEVSPASELEGLPGPGAEASSREMKVAKQLIDSLTAKFEPDKYHDTYREGVLELIEAKAQGQEVVSEPPPEKTAPVVDLMSALEASLAAVKDKGEAEDTGPAKRRASS
ncbi:MAG TPA: Ku protein [Acidimicrobiales bacterium]